MTPNGLDIKLINPRKHAKFSRNLYNWLCNKHNIAYQQCGQVYTDSDGTLWLGIPDSNHLSGQRLMAILCNGSRASSAFFTRIGLLTIVPDFWQRYMAVGRCAIDPKHEIGFFDGNERWTFYGNTRTCKWCGKHTQRLHKWTEKVKRQEWRNESDESPATAL